MLLKYKTYLKTYNIRCIYMYICVCVCVYIYIYIYIYILILSHLIKLTIISSHAIPVNVSISSCLIVLTCWNQSLYNMQWLLCWMG